MRFVVDIDHTILHTKLVNSKYLISSVDEDMVSRINELYDEGHDIILHTGRHWDKLGETLDQLDEAGISYHTLVMGKPTGDVYVDDKAVRPDEFLGR